MKEKTSKACIVYPSSISQLPVPNEDNFLGAPMQRSCSKIIIIIIIVIIIIITIITASPFWTRSKVKLRNCLHHIAVFGMEYIFLGKSRSGVGVGADISRLRSESELESLTIRRLGSPVTALRGKEALIDSASARQLTAFSL